MKKTTITIATLSLILTLVVTVTGQDRRRAPRQIGNPIGLGGTVTAGVKQTPNQVQRVKRKSPTSTGDQPEMQLTNSRPQNLGDTATHEVGHKGKRRNGQFRPNTTGDGTTQQFRKTNANGQNNRSRHSQTAHYDPIKFDGVDGVVSTTQPKNITLTSEMYNQERTKHPRRNRQINVPALAGSDKEIAKPGNPKQ